MVQAVVMTGARQPFEVRDVERRVPGLGQVLIRIRASGVCGTDTHVWHGTYIDVPMPAVLGHEPVGVIEVLGPGVTGLAVGDRVGVGWVQRGCGKCIHCARAREVYCPDPITWEQNGGGFAQFMIAEASGCVRIPDGVDWLEAAPMFCAGFTVMSGYRNAKARPGDRVAIHGAGGLGHLALQIAKAMGHEVIAITNAADKAASLRDLGADEVLVIHQHPGRELRDMGGADVILATSNNMKQTGQVLSGLRDGGTLVTMAVGDDPFPVKPTLALTRQFTIKGSSQNERADLVEVLDLLAQGRIHPVLEVYRLDEVNTVFERLDRGAVRYRAVFDLGDNA
jgi:D-arabinose 1-dehydrogenase-like Zn-dependent alcohol dehydrogenase